MTNSIPILTKLLPRAWFASGSGSKNSPFSLKIKTTPTTECRLAPTLVPLRREYSSGGGGSGLLAKLLSQPGCGPRILVQGQGQGHGQLPGRRCYSDWNGLAGKDRLLFLTDKNIESVIRSSTSLLIMFYAPWCGHCRSSKPEYARAAEMLASERPSAQLAAIDCMIYPAIYEKYEIVGYPTFKYYNGGRVIGEYHHRRKASDFVHFMLREPKNRADL